MSNAQPLVFINGKACGLLDACDRGLFYGDGLFETCKLFKGVVSLWAHHKKRLLSSAENLNIPIKNNEIDRLVKVALESALTQNITEGTLKIVVTRGVGGRGYQAPSVVRPTVIVYLYPPVAAALQAPDFTIALCDMRLGRNPRLAGHKHLNRLENVLAREEVTRMAVDEGLLRDSDDKLIECTAHNIFAFMGDKLVTPTLNLCGVKGVMREVIMQELSADLAIGVVERDLTLTDLREMDALFICNSNRGITPVTRVLNEKTEVLINYNQDPRINALQQALVERYPAFQAL